MAECEWAVLCDYAFRDEGHKTCMIGVFDRIFVRSVPAIHRQAALVVSVRGVAGESVRLRVEIERPTGASLATPMEGVAQLGEEGSAQITLQINGLQLPDYGAYTFNVYVDENPPRKVLVSVARPTVGGPH